MYCVLKSRRPYTHHNAERYGRKLGRLRSRAKRNGGAWAGPFLPPLGGAPRRRTPAGAGGWDEGGGAEPAHALPPSI